jgi:hypothetical protein
MAIRPFVWLVLLLGAAAVAQETAAPTPAWPDAPDPTYSRPTQAHKPATYREALARWKSADELNAWIGSSFVYDPARALALSETARSAGPSSAVMEPEPFFDRPRGVCIDLARFAVAALRQIEPQSRSAYLMIEFEPVEVSGMVLRRHWLARLQRADGHYFLADSRRPGHLAGPYSSVADFVANYAAYRGRTIVSYRLEQSHERRLRTRAVKAASGIATGE